MTAIVVLRTRPAARTSVWIEPERKRDQTCAASQGRGRDLARHRFPCSSHFCVFYCSQPLVRNQKNRIAPPRPARRSIPAGFRVSPAPRSFSPVRRARFSRLPNRSRRPPARSIGLSWPRVGRNTQRHNTSVSENESQRSLSLKKGPLALGVYISVAPAQGNATSVQYNAVPLKNDVPFPKDATNIEFDPNKPLLTLVSADPVDRTLDFYRRELGTLGWSLWSQKLNGVQPPGGTSGELSKSGAYAYYLQGDRHSRRSSLNAPRPAGPRSSLKNCRQDIWSPCKRNSSTATISAQRWLM